MSHATTFSSLVGAALWIALGSAVLAIVFPETSAALRFAINRVSHALVENIHARLTL